MGTGGAVHEYRVEDVHLQDLIADQLWRALEAMFHQVVKISFEWDAVAREERPSSVGNTYDVDPQLVLFLQRLLLLSDLLQQMAAHGAGADDKEVQLLVRGEEEGIVDDVE